MPDIKHTPFADKANEKGVRSLGRRYLKLKEENSANQETIRELRTALNDVFKLIDEGWLVRDTKQDHQPNWATSQLDYVLRLSRARTALRKAKGEQS